MTVKSEMLETLMQLVTGPVWDGNLISKQTRTAACEKGYAYHIKGFTILSPSGVHLLDDLGLLKRD